MVKTQKVNKHEELSGLLIAISIVSKRLAENIKSLNAKKKK